MILKTIPDYENVLILMAGLDKVGFRRQVVPGDVLHLGCVALKLKMNFGKTRGLATVDGEVGGRSRAHVHDSESVI